MEITVALGGGGAKGAAHIGVLQCLEEAGYAIRAIAGTSIGGIIGAIYAAGMSPAQMLDHFIDLNFSQLYSRRTGDGPALLGMAGIYEVLGGVIGERLFSDLRIPFAAIATDFNTGQEVILKDGRVMDAVLASMSVPGVFPPQEIGEYYLVDGGLVDPVPVSVARTFAPRLPVVAVVLSNPVVQKIQPTERLSFLGTQPLMRQIARLRVAQAFNIFIKSVDIGSRHLTQFKLQLDHPEVIIRPDVDEIELLDNVNIPEVAQRGYQATKLALPEIKEELSLTASLGRIWRNRSQKNSIE